MPEDLSWPHDEGRPLAFLCQISLAELPDISPDPGYPKSGFLFFFYDQQQGAWGFDPANKPKWRVVHSSDVAPDIPPRVAPQGLSRKAVYSPRPLSYRVIETYPYVSHPEIDAVIKTDKAFEAYSNFCMPSGGEDNGHHMFGYPDAVQNPNMDEECQLVSNGIYLGKPADFQTEEAKRLKPGASDWLLLLQLCSDDDARMMWGDAGCLYFWIRQQDLKQSNFSDVWMILQCG